MWGWDRYLTDDDRTVFERAGYGGKVGWGCHPVLLVIDVTYGFCGEKSGEVMDVVERYPTACGRNAWRAVESIKELLSAARGAEIPIVYTKPGRNTVGLQRGRWEDKNIRHTENSQMEDRIVTEVEPDGYDVTLTKDGPSAFFGTPLMRWLTGAEIDTLLICGGTTSGCVRASVVDAFSYNLRTIVIQDATFDRIEASHWVSLFDMDMKYADVVRTGQAIDYMHELRE